MQHDSFFLIYPIRSLSSGAAVVVVEIPYSALVRTITEVLKMVLSAQSAY